MSKDDWTLWSERRPEDTEAPYRWRIPERKILGMILRPEWTGKMSYCGMGYDPSEWWPPFSYWNGYHRSVPAGTEWRPAREDEGEKDIFWSGLDLLPSPFTGLPPKVGYLGRWIGAPPYEPEWLSIESFMVSSKGWHDAARMQAAWNTRPTPEASAERDGL